MKVLLNGLAALKPKTGVGHYVAELTRHLVEADPENQFDLYPGPVVGGLITKFVHRPRSKPGSDGRGKATSLKAQFIGHAKELAKSLSAVHFRAYASFARAELYHEPNFIPYRSGLPTVVTVHDLSVLRHPEWHPADRVRFHDRHFLRSLERADHVLVVSESVRRELLSDTGLSPDRVTTVYNGVSASFAPKPKSHVDFLRARFGLPEKYFLYVGTIEPRKNLGTILRAFVDLPRSVRSVCPLVLAGPWGWKSEPEREYYESTASPAGVRHLGYVSDTDLPLLYSGATALLYPSFYEGFGLPPIEMLACGGAVIASTADAVREVVGKHGELIEPLDQAGWRDAMACAATNREYIASLTRGGVDHARRFTWHRAADEVVKVYRKVLGRSSGSSDTPLSRRAA